MKGLPLLLSHTQPNPTIRRVSQHLFSSNPSLSLSLSHKHKHKNRSLPCCRFNLSPMEFAFAMSIFTSAAGISRERGKAQEWIGAWVTTRNDTEGEKPPPQQQQQKKKEEPRGQVNNSGPQEEKRRPQGRPCFAPEFDGLNCFETLVSH